MNKNLLDETLKLLQAENASFDEIGREIGTSGRWVRKVRDGIIKDPSVNKVQALYNFLEKRQAA